MYTEYTINGSDPIDAMSYRAYIKNKDISLYEQMTTNIARHDAT